MLSDLQNSFSFDGGLRVGDPTRATAFGPSRSSRSLKSSPSFGGNAMATSRPSARRRRGSSLSSARKTAPDTS